MRYLQIFLLTTLSFIQSCKNSSTCFSGSGFVFNGNVNASSKYLCGLEERFIITDDEIIIAETAICNSDSLVKDVFYAPQLRKYKRQFIGFKNELGEKVIIANLQHKRLFRNRKGDNSIYFQTEFNQGFGENFEKYQRILSVNLSNGKVSFPCGE